MDAAQARKLTNAAWDQHLHDTMPHEQYHRVKGIIKRATQELNFGVLVEEPPLKETVFMLEREGYTVNRNFQADSFLVSW